MFLKRIYIACLGISTLFSCSDNPTSIESEPKLVVAEEFESEVAVEQEQEEQKSSFRDLTDEDGVWPDLPLDSAQLIADMHLVDNGNRIDLMRKDPEKHLLSEKIDTFEMYKVTYGCICPNWNVIDCDNAGGDGYSGPCQYYIEPAHKDLKITFNYEQASTNVRFIGKKYLKDSEDGDYGESSHAGQRFKYYSFEFIRPYYVYGPYYNDTVYRNNRRDTILQTLPTILKVD